MIIEATPLDHLLAESLAMAAVEEEDAMTILLLLVTLGVHRLHLPEIMVVTTLLHLRGLRGTIMMTTGADLRLQDLLVTSLVDLLHRTRILLLRPTLLLRGAMGDLPRPLVTPMSIVMNVVARLHRL
jgi:hypothetical protein